MGQNLLTFWREEPALFEDSFASAPIMLMAISHVGRVEMATPFLASKLGRPLDDLVGVHWTDLLANGSYKKAAKRLFARLFSSGGLRDEELELCGESGGGIPVLATALVGERAKSGERRGLFLLIDNAERKRAQETQRQVDRMEAIGQLVGGVAHDYNNLLTVVQGNLELLSEDGNKTDQQGYVLEALAAARRASDLTQRLLCYGRRATLFPTSFDVCETVKGVVPALRRRLGKDLGLSVDVASDVFPVRLDEAQFQSALMSIVDNARDAMRPGDTFFLTVDNMWMSPDEAMLRPGAWAPGPYVVLTLRDTGEGMGPDVLDRMFEPYFTTRARAERSGLGMAMVEGFVLQSGGAVEVSSHTGLGTTVTLYFPADLAEEHRSSEDVLLGNSVVSKGPRSVHQIGFS